MFVFEKVLRKSFLAEKKWVKDFFFGQRLIFKLFILKLSVVQSKFSVQFERMPSTDLSQKVL